MKKKKKKAIRRVSVSEARRKEQVVERLGNDEEDPVVGSEDRKG